MKILFLGYKQNSILDFLQNSDHNITVTDARLSVEEVSTLDPDLIISYGYRHIIKKTVIEQYPNRIINLHISLLPWNRGVSPNLWSFATDTPKGVTIHLLDEGIDTGEILYQEETTFQTEVTLSESYAILRETIEKLFIKKWPKIEHNNYIPIKQDLSTGSYHTLRESERLIRRLGESGWNTKAKDVAKMVEKTDQQIIDEIQSIRQANNTHWMDVVRLAFRLAPEEARQIFKSIKQCDKDINVLLDELAENDLVK